MTASSEPKFRVLSEKLSKSEFLRELKRGALSSCATEFVVYGPKGRLIPVEPIRTPEGNLYWYRTEPWPFFNGLSEDVNLHLERIGTRNEIAFVPSSKERT